MQNKKRIIKNAREKEQVIYKVKPIEIIPDFTIVDLKPDGPEWMLHEAKEIRSASPDSNTQKIYLSITSNE